MHIYNLQKQPIDPRDHMLYDYISVCEDLKLPKVVDLRDKCPAVYDQGSLGSCTSQAGCAALSILKKQPETSFSRIFHYYNERTFSRNINVDSGSHMRNIGRAFLKYVVCEEEIWPYEIEKFAEKPSEDAYEKAIPHKIKSYNALRNLEQIKTYLATNQLPVLMAMDIFSGFESDYVKKTGKVRLPKKDEQHLGAHAVLIVGYKDGILNTGNLIVRNSWGDFWGDKGYFYLPYSYITKKLAYDFWTLSLI